MASMPVQPTLSTDQFRVLREISLRVSDGYTLMAKTGLDREKLARIAEELIRMGVVRVEGELSPDRIGEAYFQVPLPQKGRVEFLLHPLGFNVSGW